MLSYSFSHCNKSILLSFHFHCFISWPFCTTWLQKWNARCLWVLSSVKLSETTHVMNPCPTEADRNQSVPMLFQEVTNDFPLGFTVSPAHIARTAPPSTHHHHQPTPHPFLPGKRSRSITETDQCLWLGCCVRLFDEVTTIKDSRLQEEAGTLRATRPRSKQPANREGGSLLADSDGVKPESNHCN